MDSQSADEIAEEWVLAWSGKAPPAVGPGIGGPRLDWELPQGDPGLCLESIVKVLGRIDGSSPNPLLAALAGGPLEDLLAKNGGVVVDQVEVLARRNPEFLYCSMVYGTAPSSRKYFPGWPSTVINGGEPDNSFEADGFVAA